MLKEIMLDTSKVIYPSQNILESGRFTFMEIVQSWFRYMVRQIGSTSDNGVIVIGKHNPISPIIADYVNRH